MPPIHLDMSARTKKIFIISSIVISSILIFNAIRLWTAGESRSKDLSSAPANTITIKPSKAILMAKTRREEKEQLEQEAARFGILFLSEDSKVISMLARINANPKLAKTLKEVKRNNIDVFVENSFSIQPGYVCIDENASDEEIIRFLAD